MPPDTGCARRGGEIETELARQHGEVGPGAPRPDQDRVDGRRGRRHVDRFVSDRRMREARSGRSLVGHLPLLRFRIRRAAVRVFGRGLVCIGSVMIQECLGDGPGVLLSHGAAGQAYFAFMEPEEFGDGPVASQRHRERGQRPHAVRISFVKVPCARRTSSSFPK